MTMPSLPDMGFDPEFATPTGGIATITHRSIDPLAEDILFKSAGGTHPTYLQKLNEELEEAGKEGWVVCCLYLILSQGGGGTSLLVVLAKPKTAKVPITPSDSTAADTSGTPVS